MSKNLREIVREIQFKKDWTIEQVAESIGYTRVHLTKEMKKDASPLIADLLIEKYKDILQNVSRGNGDSWNLNGKEKNQPDFARKLVARLEKDIEKLEVENAELKAQVNSSLQQVLENQLAAASIHEAYQKKILELMAKAAKQKFDDLVKEVRLEAIRIHAVKKRKGILPEAGNDGSS